jgi:hypothetical protein
MKKRAELETVELSSYRNQLNKTAVMISSEGYCVLRKRYKSFYEKLNLVSITSQFQNIDYYSVHIVK